jgi:hypothetical protein
VRILTAAAAAAAAREFLRHAIQIFSHFVLSHSFIPKCLILSMGSKKFSRIVHSRHVLSLLVGRARVRSLKGHIEQGCQMTNYLSPHCVIGFNSGFFGFKK